MQASKENSGTVICLAAALLFASTGRAAAGPGGTRAPSAGSMAAGALEQQAAPGIGAGTQDPKRVLSAAREALRAVRTVTYEAAYRGVGALATSAPVVTGEAALAKLPSGDPLVAKIGAQGTFYQSGSGEGVPFRTAFDGQTIRKLRAQSKTMVVKDVGTDPKGRTLGGVTSLFGGGAYQLLMFEYVMPDPLTKQAKADVVEYEGRTSVAGVLCHVVYVEYDRRPDGRVRRERWFIGVEDNLPRRLENVFADDKGRYGAYVLALSNVCANRPLDDSAFGVQPPEGYTTVPYSPPARPALLSVGEAAPDWKLTDARGLIHALSDYRGKWVVLDFWATWCGPCVRGMPVMQALHEKYHERGVEIIGVNAWEESNAPAYMKEKGYTYVLLLEGESVAEAYHVSTLPTIYVIGRDGKIAYRGGFAEAQHLDEFLEEQLKSSGR
jgi:thiol-disulfide isomerase/thioredoxin